LIKIANRTSWPELTWATIKSRLQALGCTGKWHKQVFNIYKSVYHLLLLFAIYFAERRETKEEKWVTKLANRCAPAGDLLATSQPSQPSALDTLPRFASGNKNG